MKVNSLGVFFFRGIVDSEDLSLKMSWKTPQQN